jgi:hypothetical protein
MKIHGDPETPRGWTLHVAAHPRIDMTSEVFAVVEFGVP